MENLSEEAAFLNITYKVFWVGLLVISLLSSHDSYLPMLTMVGMPEIDILDIGMGDEMVWVTKY